MLILQMVLYGYALILLLFLLLDNRANKGLFTKTAAIFRRIILVTMLVMVVEAVTFFVDQQPGRWMYWLNYSFNSILFLIILAPLSLWLVYLDECIITDEREKKRKQIVYALFNLLAAAIVVANFFTGILFTIGEGNAYLRGPAVAGTMALNGILFFGYLPTLRRYRKFISGRVYELILALGVLPFVGAALQMLFYGTPLLWPMMALVALAAHFLVEKEEIRRDCLTGLLSRTQMEVRAQYLIGHHQPFSLILLDIDLFKSINDTYGHEEGDQALCIIANLLQKSIKQVDSAYRYAGDEFILIIESERPEAANRVVERLESNLEKYNRASQKPYKLSFSCGIVFYDTSSTQSVIELFTKADERMYQCKKLRNGQIADNFAAVVK
jgi:diguanylate cyclase (GGDEF)-like protein